MRHRPLRQAAAAARQMRAVVVQVAGCRMVARRSTVTPRWHDPPVVLLAGLGLSGRYLLPLALALGTRFHVWVPDPPGFGSSEAERTLDMPAMGDRLVAWMDSVGLGRAALVGNSMGCQYAVEAAVRHPDRVSHLVLQGPTMDAEARSGPRQAARLALNGLQEPVSLGPLEALDWVRIGVVPAVRSLRLALRHPLEERLPLVACPAVVVHGSRDPIAPRRWAEAVAGRLPGGQLRVVPGASHTMPYTTPLELARVTEGFVASRRA